MTAILIICRLHVLVKESADSAPLRDYQTPSEIKYRTKKDVTIFVKKKKKIGKWLYKQDSGKSEAHMVVIHDSGLDILVIAIRSAYRQFC